jgi:hypothetical protein
MKEYTNSRSARKPSGWPYMAMLLVVCVLGITPWRAFAQADAGYTKVGTTAAGVLTFTDATVVDGNSYQYEVTAALTPTLESVASKGPVVTIPSTGTHSTTETWGASPTPGFSTTSIGRESQPQTLRVPLARQ